MAAIQHKRSAIPGKTPQPADLADGELAMNTADGKLFFKAADGGVNIIDIDRKADIDSPALLGAPTAPTPSTGSNNQRLATTQFVNAAIAAAGAGVTSDLDKIAAMCADGSTVTIACFGDSQTDGEQTTGWTKNPVDGNGNAVGVIDHESTAPNAWPAVLKAILRAMHGNNNIHVWNAGYTAKRIVDGWALANYDKAITNNPAYGTPNVVIFGFGWNDQTVAGSQVGTFAAEMRKLIAKARGYGSIPVWVTCDPGPRNASGRDNREVSRQIDAIKTAVCAELGVTLIDVGGALQRWANGNSDGYRWREQQTDYLHWQDKGHALKAGFIAKHFYRDVINVERGRRAAAGTWDVALNAGFPSAAVGFYTASNGKFAGNWNYDRTLIGAAGTRLIDAWVYCESPEACAVYRGVDGEAGAFASGLVDGNYFELWDPVSGVTRTKRPPAMGFQTGGAGYRRSDVPAVLGDLRWGLNRISYRLGATLSGGSGTGFIGWLDFLPFKNGASRNALRDFGPCLLRTSNGSGNVASLLPEADDGCNLWGGEGTTTVELLLDLKLPVGTGFIYGHTPGFGDGSNVDGDKSFSFIYRSTSTQLKLFNGAIVAGAPVYNNTAVQTSGAIASSDDIKLRIALSRSGDNQITNVYEGFVTTTPTLTATVAQSVAPPVFGGVLGGFFAVRSDVTGTVTAELRSAAILY